MKRFSTSRFFSGILLLIAAAVQLSFVSPVKEIEWSSSRKLSWADFLAGANNSSKFSALSDCGILYKMDGQNDSVRIEIRTFFYPSRSWVKAKDKNDYLLSHEQLHFDITELFTRKLRKELLSMKLTAKNAKKKLTAAYKNNYDAYSKYQHRYDKQTNHSIDKKKQAEWSARVHRELNELAKFSSPVLHLRISH